MRAQMRLLLALRKAILEELGRAAGYQYFHLTSLISAVNAAIDRHIGLGKRGAEAAAAADVREAWGLGIHAVDAALARGALRASLVGISSELLTAALDVTGDQVRAVWSELGTRLKVIVRRTALGVTDPFQAIQQLSRIIRNPKTFGTAAARAESILRTEVNRTFSMASDERMRKAAGTMVGLKKYWLTAGDQRVRDEHAAAGQAYAIGADPGPIPFDDTFEVGGERLRYPLDPQGSAANTINCRCRAVPYVADVKLDALPARAA